MTHLFLTSSIGSPGVGESIRTRLGHERKLKTAFITTPIEGDSDQPDLSWVDEDRLGLNKNGFITFDYTITGKSLSQIESDLSDIEVLYISGGNEFYLKEKSNESGFEEFVHTFVKNGGIYIGTSCGSIIAGSDMSPIQQLSDLDVLSKPVDVNGFGLVDFTILPHWGSDDFKNRWLSEDSFNLMYKTKSPLIALNNFEYVEVIDDQYRIIDLRRGKAGVRNEK